MKTITVFTPTYNRAHLLGRLYESLVGQSSADFLWLVVDDGSIDSTRELTAAWQAEGKIQIQYAYKPNGGMHTAHSLAYDLIRTELNVCIDSDDWMPLDAVERILSVWSRYRADKTVVGLIGLDVDRDGAIIGSRLPADGTRLAFDDVYQVYGCTGDKKLVYRSDVTARAPRFPVFEGEKLVPLSWLYSQIDEQGQLVAVNQPLIIVEYQADGSSASVLKQYFQSPRGFRALREINIRRARTTSHRLKNIIHYGFSSIVIGDMGFVARSPAPLLSLLMLPASALLFAWLRMRLAFHPDGRV